MRNRQETRPVLAAYVAYPRTFGVYFLVRAFQSGSYFEAAIAGAATGLGHLAKSHLALFVAGLALVAWLLPRLRLAHLDRSRWHLGHLGIFALTGLAIGLPWELYAARTYPVEYRHELDYVARHVTESIEGWGGPTSRLAFDYLPYLHRNALPLAVAGMLALLWVAVRRRALLVGALISLSFAGSRMALALWVGTAGAAFVWRPPRPPCPPPRGDPPVAPRPVRKALRIQLAQNPARRRLPWRASPSLDAPPRVVGAEPSGSAHGGRAGGRRAVPSRVHEAHAGFSCAAPPRLRWGGCLLANGERVRHPDEDPHGGRCQLAGSR